jgi:hypothetical protein
MARYARVKGEAEEAVKESGPAVVSIPPGDDHRIATHAEVRARAEERRTRASQVSYVAQTGDVEPRRCRWPPPATDGIYQEPLQEL